MRRLHGLVPLVVVVAKVSVAKRKYYTKCAPAASGRQGGHHDHT